MAAARTDCDAIAQRFGRDEGQACAATLLYRSGQAQQAIPMFNRLVDLPDYQGPLAQDWLRYHLGDALRTAGDPSALAQINADHNQRYGKVIKETGIVAD